MTRDNPEQMGEETSKEHLKLSRRNLSRAVGAGTFATTVLGGLDNFPSMARTASATSAESQAWRPQYHFSPADGWMNDPNGLVYQKGVYHLFYQAGENSRRWDHAVSRDLVNWHERGTKISDTPKIQAFSGGGVIDEHNTAGFGKNALVVLYTGHHDNGIEDQRLAYSTNNGRTLQKYAGNPIIPSDVGSFRDPNPLWYEPDENWRMVVSRVKATDERPAGIEIYSSENLIDWTYESTYGSGGEPWECPNLYKLPVEGSEEIRWVMTVSVPSPVPNVGTTVEHHIGHFDGTEFISKEVVLADYGYDFYATQKWSNTPEDRGLNISWMSDWAYAMDLPPNGWKGAMTVPRTISLADGGQEVRQAPAEEITETRKGVMAELGSETVGPSNDPLKGKGVAGRTLELITTINPGSADQVGLRVREGKEQESVIVYDAVNKELRFDRTNSGVFFGENHYGETSAPMELLDDGTVKLRVLVDRSSVEIFANEGRRTMTNRVYPDWNSTGVSLFAEGGCAEIQHLVAYDLIAETPETEGSCEKNEQNT